jgi:predicted nucleic acid-binding protein
MTPVKGLESIHQVFLDTAPVIYFIEKNPVYAAKVQDLFQRLDEGKLTAVVSPITLAECLVVPYKLGKPDVAKIFTELLVGSDNVLFYPVDELIADKAAELRARYNVTLTDAFQLAVATQSGCDAFVTNDIDVKRVTEISIIVVAE